MNELSPIVSEFASTERAEAYERWLQQKVAASLADERPPIAHDDAMARVRQVVQAREAGGDAC